MRINYFSILIIGIFLVSFTFAQTYSAETMGEDLANSLNSATPIVSDKFYSANLLPGNVDGVSPEEAADYYIYSLEGESDILVSIVVEADTSEEWITEFVLQTQKIEFDGDVSYLGNGLGPNYYYFTGYKTEYDEQGNLIGSGEEIIKSDTQVFRWRDSIGQSDSRDRGAVIVSNSGSTEVNYTLKVSIFCVNGKTSFDNSAKCVNGKWKKSGAVTEINSGIETITLVVGAAEIAKLVSLGCPIFNETNQTYEQLIKKYTELNLTQNTTGCINYLVNQSNQTGTIVQNNTNFFQRLINWFKALFN